MNVFQKLVGIFGKAGVGILGISVAGVIVSTNANAQAVNEQPPSISLQSNSGQSSAQALAATMAYWTPERMRNATPAVATPSTSTVSQVPAAGQIVARTQPAGKVVTIPGWNPNSGLAQPNANSRITLGLSKQSGGVASPNAYGGPPPVNPTDFANMGKFQRWTLFGNYLKYPRSVLGKLFFTKSASAGGGNFVCSGTAVNRNLIITAGHCVSEGGSSVFHNTFLFCPSYYRGGPGGTGAPHPSRGCWATTFASTSSQWFDNEDYDRDYGCLVSAPTGSVIAGRMGDITGWAGITYNRGADEQVLSTGYPAAYTFPGYHIITTMAAEWYTRNVDTSHAALSKYIGNDMTGGSSGGGWLLNWEHASSRYDSRDSTNITDPFQNSGSTPVVHGINSHNYCFGSCCFTNSCPAPKASMGDIAEMGSPMFEDNASDDSDVESVYETCRTNGGDT